MLLLSSMNSTSLNMAEKVVFNPHLSLVPSTLFLTKLGFPKDLLPFVGSHSFSSLWQNPSLYIPNSNISYYAMPFLDYSQPSTISPSVYYLVLFYCAMTV